MKLEKILTELLDALVESPCQLNGNRCLAGQNHCCENTRFSKGMCPYLGTGCQNLECKLWFCETALKSMDEKTKKNIFLIESIAKENNLIKRPYLGEPYVGADKKNS